MQAVLYSLENKYSDGKITKIEKQYKYGVIFENEERRMSTGYTIIRKIQTGEQNYENICSKSNYSFVELGIDGCKDYYIDLSVSSYSESHGYFELPFKCYINKISDSMITLCVNDFELPISIKCDRMFLGNSCKKFSISDINNIHFVLTSCVNKNNRLSFKLYFYDKNIMSKQNIGFCHVSKNQWRIDNSVAIKY